MASEDDDKGEMSTFDLYFCSFIVGEFKYSIPVHTQHIILIYMICILVHVYGFYTELITLIKTGNFWNEGVDMLFLCREKQFVHLRHIYF